MPADVARALQALIGAVVTVTTASGTFTGRIASVTTNLLIMASSGNVVYIDPGQITAVTTGSAGG
jgi:hypothetical protein